MAYPTDPSDAQWRWFVTSSPRPAGEAHLLASPDVAWSTPSSYQARTGCQWRYLPGHFAAWGAIWQQFRRWRASGVWEKEVMLDYQTVKAGRGGPGIP